MRDNVDHRLIMELTLVRASQNSLSVTAPMAVAPVAVVPVAPTLRPVAPLSNGASNGNSNGVPAWKSVKPTVIAPPIVEDAPPTAEEAALGEETAPYEEEMAAPSLEAVVSREEMAPEVVEVEPEPEVEVEPVPVTAPEPKKKGRRIGSYDDLVELWPAVLMRIRKKIGVTAVAYLHDARPVGFNDDDVVLEFVKEFHHAKACDAAERLGFEKVVNETLDKPRRLKLQLAAPAPKAQPKIEEPVDDDDDEVDLEGELSGNIIDYAQSIFGADIVGRSG
jgi:hypothetical protein